MRKQVRNNSIAIGAIVTLLTPALKYGYDIAIKYIELQEMQEMRFVKDSTTNANYQVYISDWQDKQDCINKKQDSVIKNIKKCN